jgi:transcriptional regulator with XRE-family HTH domain
MHPPEPTPSDSFVVALHDLDRALDENITRAHAMKTRIGALLRARQEGRRLSDHVSGEETPLLVQLLSESAESLACYGSRVRRSEARVLYGEGMTMDQIARLFGVTRQRVSALLREDA